MRGMIGRPNANAYDKKVRERAEKRSGRTAKAILSTVFCGRARVMDEASSTQTSIWD